MAKRDKNNPIGVVYSTDPNYSYQFNQEEELPLLPPAQQKLRVGLDKRNRGGKQVTLVEGFQGPAAELEALGKKLKNACGVGGNAKEGQILIQGDHRDRIVQYLTQNGYTQARRHN